jgi:serine protease Do
MKRVYSNLTHGAAILAGVFSLCWQITCVSSAQSGDEPGISVAALNKNASGDEFDNPKSVIKSFVSQLKQLAEKEGTMSPDALYEQSAEAKTCSVAIKAATGRRLPADAIYSKARASVVIIGAIPKPEHPHRSRPAFACGFIVHKDGAIVTNAHVIETFRNMKAIGVMTSNGRVFPIKAVLAADQLNDVAVLQIEANDLIPLSFAKSVPVGATVYCLSHPVMNPAGTEYGFFAFTQGIVSGRYRMQLLGDEPVNVLTITADYAQGSSGGPILNENGEVVGMVCHTMAIEDEGGGGQMTWKLSRPSTSILALFQNEKSAK